MVMLKGTPIGLDNLIGFHKLTDVLQQLVEHLNAQDETLKELRSDVDATVARVDSQDAVVEQARLACEACVQKVESVESAIAKQEALIRSKIDPLEAQMKKFSDGSGEREKEREKAMKELEKMLKALSETTEKLQQGQAALEAHQKSADSAAAAAAEEQAAKLEASMTKIKQQLDMGLAGLVERADQVEELFKQVNERLDNHEEQFGSIRETQKEAGVALDKAKAETTASFQTVDERVATLDSDVKGGLQELRDQLSKAGNAEEIKKLGEDMKRLEGQVRELRSNAGGFAQLRQMLDALSEKEVADVSRLTKEVNILQNRLGSFLDQGASATARCLSCFDRRAQLHNTIVIGSDGKTYLKSADGAPIGKLHIPSPPVRGGSPPRSLGGPLRPGGTGLATSPPRSLAGAAGGMSPPPPALRPATSLPALG